jgi:hypothetical protein
MATSKWKPLDIRAIVWWAGEHGAKLQPPFAWPQITYLMPDGTKETKELIHVRVAYEKWRKNSKSKKKDELA